MKSKGRILVVDDEAIILETVKLALEAVHYEVAVACNGQEGLQSAIAQQPDLILLDVTMPVMDGFQLLAKLKNDERTKKIPVVMLTGRDEAESVTLSQQLKADDYLMKPFTVEHLLDLVCKYSFK